MKANYLVSVYIIRNLNLYWGANQHKKAFMVIKIGVIFREKVPKPQTQPQFLKSEHHNLYENPNPNPMFPKLTIPKQFSKNDILYQNSSTFFPKKITQTPTRTTILSFKPQQL